MRVVRSLLLAGDWMAGPHSDGLCTRPTTPGCRGGRSRTGSCDPGTVGELGCCDLRVPREGRHFTVSWMQFCFPLFCPVGQTVIDSLRNFLCPPVEMLK